MKIVNDGLPQPVFEMIQNDPYEHDGDISVTTLIGPPRIRVLTKLHEDEIEVEASTLLNVALGRAFHSAIEKGTVTGIAERRLSIEVRGWKISGGMDHFADGTLIDYKTANKWKTVLCDKGNIEEWEQQTNIYAQILRENGHPVTDIKIFALFKDWNRQELKTYLNKQKIFIPGRQSGYPEKEWLYFSLPLWDEKKAKDFIDGRVALHQAADKVIPKCTGKETWSGRRCEQYCNVNKWCLQYKEAKTTGLIEGAD